MAERVESWAYNDAAHIVGMSEGIVAGINKVLQQPERVSHIWNAVDLAAFRVNMEAQRISMREKIDGRGQIHGCSHRQYEPDLRFRLNP